MAPIDFDGGTRMRAIALGLIATTAALAPSSASAKPPQFGIEILTPRPPPALVPANMRDLGVVGHGAIPPDRIRVNRRAPIPFRPTGNGTGTDTLERGLNQLGYTLRNPATTPVFETIVPPDLLAQQKKIATSQYLAVDPASVPALKDPSVLLRNNRGRGADIGYGGTAPSESQPTSRSWNWSFGDDSVVSASFSGALTYQFGSDVLSAKLNLALGGSLFGNRVDVLSLVASLDSRKSPDQLLWSIPLAKLKLAVAGSSVVDFASSPDQSGGLQLCPIMASTSLKPHIVAAFSLPPFTGQIDIGVNITAGLNACFVINSDPSISLEPVAYVNSSLDGSAELGVGQAGVGGLSVKLDGSIKLLDDSLPAAVSIGLRKDPANGGLQLHWSEGIYDYWDALAGKTTLQGCGELLGKQVCIDIWKIWDSPGVSGGGTLAFGEGARAFDTVSVAQGPTLLIRRASDGATYVVQSGRRRWIPDPQTFAAMGFDWNQVMTMPDYLVNMIADGGPLPSRADGALVMRKSDGSVYLMMGARRHGIPDPGTFAAMGLDWSRVSGFADADIAAIPDGGAIFGKPGNNGTVSCNQFCSNIGANWGRLGSCGLTRIGAGPRARQSLGCGDVPGFGNDTTCYCAAEPDGAFLKSGNNGTVSCETFCLGAQWGSVGDCVDGRSLAASVLGASVSCASVPGLGPGLACVCRPQQGAVTFAKPGNNGTVNCSQFCANNPLNWGPPGSCDHGSIGAGPRSGQRVSCTDVPGFGNDLTCFCTPTPKTGK